MFAFYSILKTDFKLNNDISYSLEKSLLEYK